MRIDKQLVNRRVIEALVRAGAFDELDADRAKLLASVGRAMDMAEHSAAHANQASLFGGGADEAPEAPQYIAAAPWTTRERLANEKLALGYYFSGHLFTEVAAEARRFAPRTLAEVRAMRTTTLRGEVVRCAGIIVSARTQNTRRGRMGVVTLDDGSEQLEIMVFSELFDRRRALLKEDTLLFVGARLRFDEASERLSVNADELMNLEEARARNEARLRIEIDTSDGGRCDLPQLKQALAPYRVVPIGNGHAAPNGNGDGRAERRLPHRARLLERRSDRGTSVR